MATLTSEQKNKSEKNEFFCKKYLTMNKKHDIILNCIIIARIVETLVIYDKLQKWQFAQKA
ncbi:MAG: hypothetical protein IJW29_08005 [Clostridia bacterium]|nr:hypothetical protein [Clostridia bacterium]